MSVGIHAVYQKCDTTLMALRAARHFRDLGHRVDYLPRGDPVAVHPEWDGAVLGQSSLPFHLWARQRFSHILWDDVPVQEHLLVARTFGARNLLLVQWDELDDKLVGTYKLFDRLLCSSWLLTSLLADRLRLNNVSYIPWDVGVPLTNGSLPVSPGVRLFWSLWGAQAWRQNGEVMTVFDQALATNPMTQLTVGYAPDGMDRQTLRALQALGKHHPGRVCLLKNNHLDRQILHMARHDLTVWPSLAAAAGLCGLYSLSVSVPVLAFDSPLIGEFLRDGKNALLVACQLRYNSLGVPIVDPQGYRSFAQRLDDAVRNPRQLWTLRKRASIGLLERKELFTTAWKNVLAE